MKYKSLIIKLSGEALSGAGNFGFDFKKIKNLAKDLESISKNGIRIGIMIGGGNIFRGRMVKNNEIDCVIADKMGMVATVLNSMCLSGVIESIGLKSKVISAFEVSNFVEKFSVQKCLNYWKKNNILVFAGGTGNPYFTTDTSAVEMARLLKADIVLKATQVDGVYNKDPKLFKGAKKFESLKITDAISKKLKIMDIQAFEIAKKSNIPIRVFKLSGDNLKKVATGFNMGTIIKSS